jgi:hypothetical protein
MTAAKAHQSVPTGFNSPVNKDSVVAHGFREFAPVSQDLVDAWAEAYRQYSYASDLAARSLEGDFAAAREMAGSSYAVAAAWRGIAAVQGLPWWALAAVESAAQAFEIQAHAWESRVYLKSGGA